MGSSSYVTHTKLQTSGSSPMLLTPQLLSPRSESISSKVKKILTASPKVVKEKIRIPQNRTFGVPLEYLNERDQCDVPVIVTRLCEYLKLHGLKHEGLFRVNGNMKVVDRLKTTFDMYGDADIEEIGDIAAVASLLKLFLRELADPVIPEELQPLFIKIQDQHGKDKKKAAFMLKELILRMPRGNAFLLKYLCEFMLSIADGSSVNKMTPLALAIVFGPNIFRCGEGLEGLREQAYVNAILLIILQEFHEIFQINNELFPDSEEVGQPEKPIPYFEQMKVMKNKLRHKTIYSSDPVLLDSGEKDSSDQTSFFVKPKITINAIEDKTLQLVVSDDDGPLHNLSHSYSTVSSPLNKNLVTKMINTSVKEHLFGSVMSSTESEASTEHSPMLKLHQDAKNDSNVKGRLNKPKKNSLSRTLSSPYKFNKKSLTDNDLMYIAERTNSPLEPLTATRAPPPQNRRKMSRSSSLGNKKQVQNVKMPVPPLDLYQLSFEVEGKQSVKELNMRFSNQASNPTQPDHSSPTPADKYRNDPVLSDMTQRDLKKRMESLKKVIKAFEENFEELEGRKPKASEKHEIQKYITELGKVKKQIKDESFKTTDILFHVPSKHTDSNPKESADSEDDVSKEDTLITLLSRLDKKRKEAGRPHDIMEMSFEELKEEKLAIQKSLLQYENLHGRPETKEDKILMRPLYDRYRKIKQCIGTSGRIISPVKKNIESGHFDSMDFTSSTPYKNNEYFSSNYHSNEKRRVFSQPKNEVVTSPRHHVSPASNRDILENGKHLHCYQSSRSPGAPEGIDHLEETFNITKKLNDTSSTSPTSKNYLNEAILHDATLSELLAQQNETKRAKKRLGKLLKEFEENFFIDKHRKVQKEDRVPKEREYREYKLVKAKLRLIDALVAKKSEYNRVA